MSIVKDTSLFRSQAYINGEWVDADSGVSVPVTNPADGSTLISVPDMGADETVVPLKQPMPPCPPGRPGPPRTGQSSCVAGTN